MTPAEQALRDLRETLAEVHQFLVDHGLEREWAKVSVLAAMAAVEDETAESVLRDIWRERLHTMGRRDGFDEVYVTNGTGGVDRAATRQLDELRDRLRGIIKDWGPPARE